ncbi:MAG: LPS assembly protein LptD [Thermodesulfobacteriota bacterium]
MINRAAKALFGVLFVLLLAALPVGAQEIPPYQGDWTMTADNVTHDAVEDVYTATGNVTVIGPDQSFTADKVVYNRSLGIITAEGNVVAGAGKDSIQGDSFTYRLEDGTGIAKNATLYMKQNQFTFKGEEIEKVSSNTYRLYHVDLTTCPYCPPEAPDWKITATSAKVTLEGYGSATNAGLWIKNVPVMYMPYFAFPAKTKRQSGVLAPEFGQSQRKGLFATLPLYWAPRVDFDATLYESYLEKRGLQSGLEARWAGRNGSKAGGLGTYLYDKQVDDGKGTNSEDWGYPQDDFLRDNHSRYWVVAKADENLQNGIKLRADVDLVSDQDYLREFKTGYMGYDSMESYFIRRFGRSLDDYDAYIRENRLHGHKAWDRYTMNADLVWRDNIVARNLLPDDPTIQELPSLRFDAVREPVAQVFSKPVFFTLQAKGTHFYRQSQAQGSRLDLYPALSLPFFVGPVELAPSAGFRETVWRVDTWGDGPEVEDKGYFREMYDLGLSATTRVSRTYGTSLWGMDRLRHTIAPTLSYQYVPDRDQERYPTFDNLDRIPAQNLVTLSVTNTLLGRKPLAAPPGQEGAPAYAYPRILWLEISESYDINEQTQDDPALWATPGQKQPFSPLFGRIAFSPGERGSLFAETSYSLYDSEVEYLTVGAAGNLPQGHNVLIQYTKTTGYDESVTAAATVRALRSVALRGTYEYDLYSNQRIRTSLGALYEAACWSLDLSYTDEPGEQQVGVYVSLKGLGAVGGSAAPFE